MSRHRTPPAHKGWEYLVGVTAMVVLGAVALWGSDSVDRRWILIALGGLASAVLRVGLRR